MPSVAISPPPKLAFYTSTGAPLVGGRIYTYLAGTSTPYATYTDYNGTTANANPVVLDSRGEASIWLEQGVAYKFEVRDASNVLIYIQDGINYVGLGNIVQTFANGSAASPSVRFSQALSSGLFSPASNQLGIAANGAEAIRIDSSQNVGINGTPTTKLDVYGTTRLQGAVTVTVGGVTINAGGLNIAAGGMTVAGTVTMTGTLNLTGGITMSSGLTVSAGGAAITGNSTVAGSLTVSAGAFSSRGFTDNATAASWQIDASGRLLNTAQTQPGFSARRSSNSGTSGVLIFNDVSFTGGYNSGAYSTSTGVFTAPVAGDYLVCANLQYNDGGAGTPIFQVLVNGTLAFTPPVIPTAIGTYYFANVHMVMRLAAGNTLSLSCAQVTFGSPFLANSTFSVRQVG